MNIKDELILTKKLNEQAFYKIVEIARLFYIKQKVYDAFHKYEKQIEPKFIYNSFMFEHKQYKYVIYNDTFINLNDINEFLNFAQRTYNKIYSLNSQEDVKNYDLYHFFDKVVEIFIQKNLILISDNLQNFFYQKELLKDLAHYEPDKYLFSNDEEIENFINDYYLIKEKLKYNVENYILDKDLISQAQSLFDSEYGSTSFPNKNYRTYFPNKSRSKQDLDKYFQDKPIYKFFQKIKKYTEIDSNFLFENKAKFENLLIKLESLNFNNQELQLIFNKENIKKLLNNNHDLIFQNKEALLNFTKSKKDLSTLLQIIHSNTLISDKFKRTQELTTLAPENKFQIFKYKDLLQEQALFHTQKEANIFNDLVNNKNLTNLNSDLFQKYFKILTILKSKNIEEFINKFENKIQDLLPDFNKKEFLNTLNKIKNKDFKLSIKDKFIDKTLSTLNSIVAVNELHKYTKLAKPKIPQTNINFSIDDFQFKSLDYKDPLALTIGNDTDCCQKIGGAGAQSAIDSYINPTANVLVLYKDNKIIAQSYFHVTKFNNQNLLILDNVEVNNFNSKNININTLYKSLANHLVNNNIFDKVLCGKQYNKLNEKYFKSHNLQLDPRHFQVKNIYTDFNYNNHLILND